MIGSEQANNCGAELVELMIRLGSSHTISNQPHMKRCLFTAFKVIITLDVISVSALQRVLLSFASQPRPPLFYMKFLYECSQNKPQLSQFICTQVYSIFDLCILYFLIYSCHIYPLFPFFPFHSFHSFIDFSFSLLWRR